MTAVIIFPRIKNDTKGSRIANNMDSNFLTVKLIKKPTEKCSHQKTKLRSIFIFNKFKQLAFLEYSLIIIYRANVFSNILSFL